MEEMTTNQPVTEEPKKSGKKAGIIVAVIAVIAIIAAAAYFMAPKKDAKNSSRGCHRIGGGHGGDFSAGGNLRMGGIL